MVTCLSLVGDELTGSYSGPEVRLRETQCRRMPIALRGPRTPFPYRFLDDMDYLQGARGTAGRRGRDSRQMRVSTAWVELMKKQIPRWARDDRVGRYGGVPA